MLSCIGLTSLFWPAPAVVGAGWLRRGARSGCGAVLVVPLVVPWVMQVLVPALLAVVVGWGVIVDLAVAVAVAVFTSVLSPRR